MSTPNQAATAGLPVKHATPSQTAATPRSVPSPALSRAHPASQSVRTPQPSGFTKGGIAMAPSLSQTSAVSGSSGRGQGLGILGSGGIRNEGISPATLGVSGASGIGSVASSTLLNFASPNAMAALEGIVMGAPGMGLGISDMGRGKRDEDEERRRKVVSILSKLNSKDRGKAGGGMGRISDEGVRRVGRWAGFDVEIERKYQDKGFEGSRPILIAGRILVVIDVAFQENLISKVEVTFTSQDEHVAAHQADAAKVLKQDLTAPDGVAAINTKLDRFAANLEALARLDKLSSVSVNCLEAISGVYASLKRLFEHEKQTAEALIGEGTRHRERKIMDEVTCRKSGRPAMHAHRRLGLSLDYWIGARVTSPRAGADEMDIDQLIPDEEDDVYTLELTVQPNDPSTFPSLRVSPSWLPDSPFDLSQGIPWLDPPASFTPDIPSARFVAHLHPPIVLPYAVASQLLLSTGLQAPTVDQASSYEAALLSLPPTTTSDPALTTSTPATSRTRRIARRAGQPDAIQTASLHVPRQELAFTLHELPFAHPRALVDALPVLRQWACLGRLLRVAFLRGADDPVPAAPAARDRPVAVPAGRAGDKNRKKVALEALLAPLPAETDGEGYTLDVSLATGAAASLAALAGGPMVGAKDGPSLALFFASGEEQLVALTVRVLPGGEVVVSSSGEGGREGGEEEMGRALRAVGWDLGVWVEWVRRGR